MTGDHRDAWGDAVDPDNLRDWSKWPTWRFWDGKYDWRDGADFQAYDVIAWRDEIYVNRSARRPERKALWEKTGERMVIAEVREGTEPDDGWVYLVVIHSEGDEPLARDEKVRRRHRNIVRHGVMRWPRSGRASLAETERVAAQFGRAENPALNAPAAPAPLPVQSRFFGGANLPPPSPR